MKRFKKRVKPNSSPTWWSAGEGNILGSLTPTFYAKRLIRTHNLKPYGKQAYR